MRYSFIVTALIGTALGGCAQDDVLRTEGLSLTAGDSIARNTALQVIDPWPANVENTDLSTPADRGDKPTVTKEVATAPSTANQ